MVKKPRVVVVVVNNARLRKPLKTCARVGGLPDNCIIAGSVIICPYGKARPRRTRVSELPPLPENCVYLYYDNTRIPVGVACYGKTKGNVSARTKAQINKLSKAYARFLGVQSLQSYCDCKTENGTTKCTCYYDRSKRLQRRVPRRTR